MPTIKSIFTKTVKHFGFQVTGSRDYVRRRGDVLDILYFGSRSFGLGNYVDIGLACDQIGPIDSIRDYGTCDLDASDLHFVVTNRTIWQAALNKSSDLNDQERAEAILLGFQEIDAGLQEFQSLDDFMARANGDKNDLAIVRRFWDYLVERGLRENKEPF